MRPPQDSPTFPATGGLARWFVENRGAGWTALVAVLVWGAVSLVSLPQQEDPALPGRLARVLCVWPGASAADIETLVARPLERRIAALDSMTEVRSESRESVCVFTLGQRPARPAVIEQEWNKLRAGLEQVELPAGCGPATLQTEFGDVVTLLLAVTATKEGGYAPLTAAARQLVDELRQVPEVGRVQELGAVGETIELSSPITTALPPGLSLSRTATSLAKLGQPLPGSRMPDGPFLVPVRLEASQPTEAGLRALVVGTSSEGTPLRLEDVFPVHRADPSPLPLTADVLRRDGRGKLSAQRSVMVSVEMRTGQSIGRFARSVRQAVDALAPRLGEGIRIVTISDQPQSVATRLDRFQRCFLEAVAVILFVAVLLMEWRAALVVACAIPLTLAMTFGGMAVAGIPLHQVSIAALIISLGMLVDDPVVAADGINRELAAGSPHDRAAWFGPWKLRRPIFFATVINIFAFLPLLLLPGDKRSFIHALPVVVSLSLVCSRVVSMTFVPLLGHLLLKGQEGFEHGTCARPFPFRGVDRAIGWMLTPYRSVLTAGLRHPRIVLIAAYSLLAASLTLAPRLGRQFFPPAERPQFLVDVILPESSSPDRTRAVCDDVVRTLDSIPEIAEGARFVGGSAPRFYYNVTPRAPADHVAQFVLTARHEDEVPEVVGRLRSALDRDIASARCVVRRLEQGPPVEAPIHIRLTGPDRAALQPLAEQVTAILRNAGAYKVSDTLGIPRPVRQVRMDPARAARAGVGVESFIAAIRAAGPGLELTRLNENGMTVPVLFRWTGPDDSPLASLNEVPVETSNGSFVPLASVADQSTLEQYATLQRHQGTPSVAVEALAPEGELPATVLDRARPLLDRLVLPSGCRLSYEGEARELTESRREMGGVMAVSLGLIALALVIQFRSVGRAAVVMLTVPLGLIGALVGLSLAHVPLGFMAMLACVSLAGVIVSHIIVLSDAVDEALAGTHNVHQALVAAGLSRLRPVLVTTLATAGGLVPLALTGGALWQPLSAVHIAGLLVATTLTLVVLPVWYAVLIRPDHGSKA